jgi:integrase
MPKAKKLPSGNYRAQVFAGWKTDEHGIDAINPKSGKRIPMYESITATTKDEAEYLAAQYKYRHKNTSAPSELTVGQAIDNYINSRSNLLSPTTIQGYRKIRKKSLQGVMAIKVRKITQENIQAAVNADALTLAAKTIKNAHGLLAAMLNTYRPEMRLRTRLPAPIKKFKELPSAQSLFDAVRGKEIELAALLAMWLSFSMSEIRGIKKADIKDGILTLNRVIVDVDGKPLEKKAMKAYERSRRHVAPPYIMSLIDKCPGEYIVPLNAHQIDYWFDKALRDSNVPRITFHDLRHVNASVMLLLGIPDKYAMERGGWKTPETMKAVYQNVFSNERLEVDKKVDAFFAHIVTPESCDKSV